MLRKRLSKVPTRPNHFPELNLNYIIAHAALKNERKNLYLEEVFKATKEREKNVLSQTREPLSALQSSQSNLAHPPFFVSFENKYVIMLRHVLGTQCYVEIDGEQKILRMVLEVKDYLIPSEFKMTKLFEMKPDWEGRFDNMGQNQSKTFEHHVIRLPADTNVEEVNIDRYDHQTCFGWLVELHFEKQLVRADHLKPKASLWGLLEEKPKEGRGADVVMAEALKQHAQKWNKRKQ